MVPNEEITIMQSIRSIHEESLRQDLLSFVEICKSWVYPTVAKFPLGESDVKPKVPSELDDLLFCDSYGKLVPH